MFVELLSHEKKCQTEGKQLQYYYFFFLCDAEGNMSAIRETDRDLDCRMKNPPILSVPQLITLAKTSWLLFKWFQLLWKDSTPLYGSQT